MALHRPTKWLAITVLVAVAALGGYLGGRLLSADWPVYVSVPIVLAVIIGSTIRASRRRGYPLPHWYRDYLTGELSKEYPAVIAGALSSSGPDQQTALRQFFDALALEVLEEPVLPADAGSTPDWLPRVERVLARHDASEADVQKRRLYIALIDVGDRYWMP